MQNNQQNSSICRWSDAKYWLTPLALTFIIYIPSLFSYFQQDDWGHLTTVTQPGFNPWLFGQWFYRPLFLAAFGGLYKAFGLNAGAWHIVELMLHLINVALVYHLIRRLKFGQSAATVGALAFGVFPLSTNAAAWLSDISGIAATTLCLAAALIALSDRISVLIRGVLCAVVWASALFFKEESASMIAVLPLLPLFNNTNRSRREWIVWFASCLMMVGAFAFFMHMEGQCQHTLGNANARVSLELLRRAATFVLWPTSMGLPIFAASEIWMPAILVVVPIALWLLYPSLRPGIFWLITTGLSIGIALKYLAPAGRYFYIPAIGICLCIAALVQRLSAVERPVPFITRFIAALLVVWIVSIGAALPAVSIAAGLIVMLWKSGSDEKDKLDHAKCTAALAAACIFTLLEYLSVTLSSVGYFPIWLTLVVPLAIAAVFIINDPACRVRPSRRYEYVLLSCLAFWTQQPTALIFLLALICIRLTENKKQNTSVKPIGAWAGILAGAIIILPWTAMSISRNLTWLHSGQIVRSAVSRTAHIMSRLPKGSDVVVVDKAGMTSPEPRILQAASRLIARRSDLRIKLAQEKDPKAYNIVCDSQWRIKLYRPDN
ncbi:MAG: hypothetical protein ABFD83_11445 [Armatimonadota bacterium]